MSNGFAPVAPRLRAAMEKTGTRRILDICAGGDGPWPRLEQELREGQGFPVDATLTDLYPNLSALTYLLPLIPLAAWFDVVVSVLRVYSVPELEALTEGLDDYDWEADVQNIGAGPIGITYLIGTPRAEPT